MLRKVYLTKHNFSGKLKWGWRRAIAWYFFEALKRFLNLHIYRVWTSSGPDIAWESLLPKNIPEEYPTHILQPVELVQFSTPENDLPVEFLEEAQARHDKCGASFYEGNVVSYGFASHSRAPVTSKLDMVVPPGLVYHYKAWTHRDHRRKGITLYRSKAYIEDMIQSGEKPKRGFWYMEYHNYPSLLTGRYEPPEQRPIYLGIVGWAQYFGQLFIYNGRKAKWMGTVLVRKDESPTRTYPYT